MDKRESELERLLRAARGEEGAPEMPFGFDTRVVALARATQPGQSNSVRELVRAFRRIAAGGLVVASIATAATYWQLVENEDLAEPMSNNYAFVDTAISSELVE